MTHCNISQPPRKHSVFINIAAVALIALGIVQGIFYFVQRNHTENVQKSVEGILRNEANLREPYRIAQTLTDFESLGILRCSVFKDQHDQIVFQDLRFKHSSSQCQPSFLRLNGLEKSMHPVAINGQRWDVFFVSSNPSSFFVLLWLARIFGTLTSIMIYVLTKRYLTAQLQQAELRRKITDQVAHDIRSPLAALDAVVNDIDQLPEEHRVLLRRATSRVRDIAHDLLRDKVPTRSVSGELRKVIASGDVENSSVWLLSGLIDSIISEKRSHFRSKTGIEISAKLGASAYGIFALIDRARFQRTLSNLINNSVESLNDQGNITVSLTSETSNSVSIAIQDTGMGIPAERLPELMQEGKSFGKADGSGLGLYSARIAAESWGGSLHIASTVGKGTTVTIRLPRAVPPSWFVPSLMISTGQNVVVLDDDESIHQIWQNRIETLRSQHCAPILHHLTTPQELTEWISTHDGDLPKTLFLIDYELRGHQETGLDLIEQHQIAEMSILVTSRNDDQMILDRLARLRVRLIPKGLAPFVPITVAAPAALVQKFNCILIDDDTMVHMTWKLAVKNTVSRLAYFYSASDFLARAAEFDKSATIYIDSNLDNGVHGEEVSKEIFALGFHEIYLITGYPKTHFPDLPHIRGILDKGAPW